MYRESLWVSSKYKYSELIPQTIKPLHINAEAHACHCLAYLCYDGTPSGESLLPDKRLRQNALNVLPLRAYQGKTPCQSMVRLARGQKFPCLLRLGETTPQRSIPWTHERTVSSWAKPPQRSSRNPSTPSPQG